MTPDEREGQIHGDAFPRWRIGHCHRSGCGDAGPGGYGNDGWSDGRSGRRVKQVWEEIGRALVEKTKSFTLNQLSTKTQAEMYYI